LVQALMIVWYSGADDCTVLWTALPVLTALARLRIWTRMSSSVFTFGSFLKQNPRSSCESGTWSRLTKVRQNFRNASFASQSFLAFAGSERSFWRMFTIVFAV